MKYFGIDPGTAVTGYGIIQTEGNRLDYIDAGVIVTQPKSGLGEKLNLIYDSLQRLFMLYKPDFICIEEAFYAKNVHTTMVLGQARGVALLAAFKAGIVIHEFSPREIKKAVVGNGNATKEQVMFMVRMLLRIPQENVRMDMYDALAAAICSFYHMNTLKIGSVPCKA
ncbi:MAG: crossover junction endodeoxyribonuclease RuvC [Chitinivibrionales bacterium]|nr:crossover junction endodeoxyribonuclease RuvC [Chitinivibrionales bacterium]